MLPLHWQVTQILAQLFQQVTTKKNSQAGDYQTWQPGNCYCHTYPDLNSLTSAKFFNISQGSDEIVVFSACLVSSARSNIACQPVALQQAQLQAAEEEPVHDATVHMST